MSREYFRAQLFERLDKAEARIANARIELTTAMRERATIRAVIKIEDKYEQKRSANGIAREESPPSDEIGAVGVIAA